jgi:archaellum component FlaC
MRLARNKANYAASSMKTEVTNETDRKLRDSERQTKFLVADLNERFSAIEAVHDDKLGEINKWINDMKEDIEKLQTDTKRLKDHPHLSQVEYKSIQHLISNSDMFKNVI